MTASIQPLSPKYPTWLQWSMVTVGVLLLTIWLYSPVKAVADVGLDSSNYASYAYFTGHDFQYGTDVIPMAGPYGFVPYGFTHAGYLFWKRIPLELLTKLVLGILIVWFARRTPQRPVLTCLWLLSVILLAPLITDLPYTLAILLSGLCMVEYHVATNRKSLVIVCGLAAYLALLTLFKGTQCMLAGATLGLLCLQAILLRNFSRLPWILGSYIAALVSWLILASQNPLNFPSYFAGMLEISSGYNLAMGAKEPLAYFVTGVGALIGLELLIVALLYTYWRQPKILAAGLYFAGFSFISWKHGFVRADGHIAIFYHYICIAVPMLLLIPNLDGKPVATRSRRYLLMFLAVITLGFGIWGDGVKAALRFQWTLNHLTPHFAGNIQQLSSLMATKLELDLQLERTRELYKLENVRNIVGQRSIDFYGNEQGFLLLNRLNYHPRPIGGGTFSVFTSKLQDINTNWLCRVDHQPDYYLVKVHTLDDRLTAQEDSATLRFLLSNYSPVLVELGIPLFKRLPDIHEQATPRFLSSNTIYWNEPVTVPRVSDNEILHVSFSIPFSGRGRLQTILYKPPFVFMDMVGEGIVFPLNRRVIPSMFERPVPLNPVIENTQDLLNLYLPLPVKSVRQFTLKTDAPSLFSSKNMEVRFYVSPRPRKQPSPPEIFWHPQISNQEPIIVETQLKPVGYHDNKILQIIVPPGRMGFNLAGDENSLTFSYGMDEASYLGGSDGVDIRIQLEYPDKISRELFRRYLSPSKVPTDQGLFTQVISLPPAPPGSKLWLTTGPGPNNDGAWDLSYFTAIKIGHGSYHPDVFPRFSRVPEYVNADHSGPMSDSHRNIYMLNAPGRLYFVLRGDEQVVKIGYGLLDGAHQNGGNSDGVELKLYLRTKEKTETVFFSHDLDPRQNIADRGDQELCINLPAFDPGSQLVLEISSGRMGDSSWDWAYIESFTIE